MTLLGGVSLSSWIDNEKHFQRQNLNIDFLNAYEFASIELISLLSLG